MKKIFLFILLSGALSLQAQVKYSNRNLLDATGPSENIHLNQD